MRNAQVIILSADDSASATGAAFDAGQIVSASFQAFCGDATANGTIKIQASNDNPASSGTARAVFVPTNWTDIPSASASITSGASVIIPIYNMAYSYIRAVYTRSSGGSSTITVAMNSLSI